MDEQEKTESKPKNEKVKSVWQLEKESWYDQVPLTVKQLDIIIGVAVGLLALIFFLIILDAANII